MIAVYLTKEDEWKWNYHRMICIPWAEKLGLDNGEGILLKVSRNEFPGAVPFKLYGELYEVTEQPMIINGRYVNDHYHTGLSEVARIAGCEESTEYFQYDEDCKEELVEIIYGWVEMKSV